MLLIRPTTPIDIRRAISDVKHDERLPFAPRPHRDPRLDEGDDVLPRSAAAPTVDEHRVPCGALLVEHRRPNTEPRRAAPAVDSPVVAESVGVPIGLKLMRRASR